MSWTVPAQNTGGASNFSELAGTAAVNQGGTGATTASGARTNLGAQASHANLTDISGLANTKGNIIVGNGSNLAALGVGTDDFVLTADAAAPNGVAWKAASGGGGLSNASDITDGIQVEGADSADNLKITVDASGNATLAPTGAEITLAPTGGSSGTRKVNIFSTHSFGNASAWLGFYATTGGQQFFVGGASVLYTASTGVHMSTGKLIHRATVAGITASTTQSQGQGALTGEVNEISTCATANDTVTLSQAAAGKVQVVINNGAETAQVFPASGDAIDGGSVNASTTVAAGETAIFFAYDSTNWVKK